MPNNKVYQVKNKNSIVKRYRIIPYEELIQLLKNDEVVFFEDSKEQPLNRSTIWKAARKLSQMIGGKVVAQRALYRLADGVVLEGYLFSVV